jgi:hypothetical protein
MNVYDVQKRDSGQVKNAARYAFTFFRKENRWFLNVPEFLLLGSSASELEMTDDVPQLLDVFSDRHNSVSLRIETEPFPGADMLELAEICAAPVGGAHYLVRSCHGRRLRKKVWICDLSLCLFGDLPPVLYIRKASAQALN